MPERVSLESYVLLKGPPPNHEQFVSFLKLMLELDPEKRASLNQLLAHEWLKTDTVDVI